jgi:hypothetical protein
MFAAITAARSERWLSPFVPGQLARKLTAMGFSKVVHFSADDTNQCYLRGRRDGMALSRLEEMWRATV